MQDDLKERLRRIVKKPYSAKRGPPPCELQMLDRIAALEAKLAKKDALLRECGEALAEYACHGGPDLPCIRSKDQCRTECGKIAGDTLAKIKDATDAVHPEHSKHRRVDRLHDTRHRGHRTDRRGLGTMTDMQTPPDWVLLEAAKRCAPRIVHEDLRELRLDYAEGHAFAALCDMIAKYEQPPVDRKLLCAREAWREWMDQDDRLGEDVVGVRAIELWEEEFGK
jgi:hypothetical protein